MSSPTFLDAGPALTFRVAHGAARGGDIAVTVELADGRVVVAVADVSGHGAAAGPAAARLARVLAGLAASGVAPAEALARLDEHLRGVGDEVIATAAYAVLDPATCTAFCASAGHPPWVLVAHRGVGYLPVPPGPPLGLGCAYEETPLALAPCATLLGFTDGLVERRGEDIDEGLERLLRVLETAQTGSLDDMVRTAFDVLAEGTEDDALLLGIRLRPAAAGRILTIPAPRREPAPEGTEGLENLELCVTARGRGRRRRGAHPGRRRLREQRDGRAGESCPGALGRRSLGR